MSYNLKSDVKFKGNNGSCGDIIFDNGIVSMSLKTLRIGYTLVNWCATMSTWLVVSHVV